MDYSTNKPDRHEITEILLKVTLNTITITPQLTTIYWSQQSTGHNNLLVTTIYWSQQSTGHNNLLVTMSYWSQQSTGHNNLLVTMSYWSQQSTGHYELLKIILYVKGEREILQTHGINLCLYVHFFGQLYRKSCNL